MADPDLLHHITTWSGCHGPAVIDTSDGSRLFPADLAELMERTAGGLVERGVEPGGTVLWQTPGWWESVVLFLACWRLGAVAVPIHHRAGTADVAAAAERVQPAVVVTAHDLPAVDLPGAIRLRRGSGLPDGPAPPVVPADPFERAAILHTSGSSGAPKAVVHTHRSLGHKATQMAEVHGLGPADAVLMPAPLAHVSGLLNGVLLPGAAGMTTVLMERWDPARALQLIEAERVTFMVGPPTFFLSMAAEPGFTRERVASLRLVSAGGSGVSADFVRDFTGRLGATVKRTYGSTEAPTVTTSRVDDPAERAAATDGRPTPGTEVVVADPDTDQPVPAGEVGEIRVRGPEVASGYLDADQTAEAFTADGWFRTGDRGWLDDQGWLTVAGRGDDVIIRGGENVSARAAQTLLEQHPLVRAALVVGVPDEVLGQRVGALVVSEADFDRAACRSWFAAQGAAVLLTPEVVAQVDELPLLPSGKPDRAEALRRLRAGGAI